VTTDRVERGEQVAADLAFVDQDAIRVREP
jgi:hypothetical protein